MSKLNEANVRVIAEVMGERYEVTGVADISKGVNTDLVRAAIDLDPKLITRKVKQELAARLRELADKLEHGES